MCGIEPVPVIDAAFVEDAEELDEDEEEEVELSQDADSSGDVLVSGPFAISCAGTYQS